MQALIRSMSLYLTLIVLSTCSVGVAQTPPKSVKASVSLNDTIAFIKGHLSGSSITQHLVLRDGANLYRHDYKQVTLVQHTLRIEEDTRMESTPDNQGVIVTDTLVHRLDLSQLSLGSSTLISEGPNSGVIGLGLVFTNAQSTTSKLGEFRENKVLVFVDDQMIANRLLRAFEHAATLCGAKKEVF